jgi:hypothetical protein
MSDPHVVVNSYRKSGSMSFLDNENQMVIDAILQEIAEELLDEWMNNNLDEGQYFADLEIASRSNSNYLKGRFNQFYDLNPEHDDYLEWDKEA